MLVGIDAAVSARVRVESLGGVTLGGLQGETRGIDTPQRDRVLIGGPTMALAVLASFSRLSLGLRAHGVVEVPRNTFVVGGIGQIHRPSAGWVGFSLFFRMRVTD